MACRSRPGAGSSCCNKATGDAAWQSLGQLYAQLTQLTLCVVDHTGRPITQASLEYKDASGAGGSVSISGGQIVLPATVKQFRWAGDSTQADTLPVISLYESGASAAPGEWLGVPAGTGPWHAQLLDLSRWFAKPPAGVSVARYRADSAVEPLVDGIATFRRLVDDLQACAHPGHGAHFAGWVFKDFVLDADRGDDTQFSKLIEKVNSGGGGVRLLVNQLLNVKEGVNQIAIPVALVGLALAPSTPAVAQWLGKLETDLRGYVCLAVAIPVSSLWSARRW